MATFYSSIWWRCFECLNSFTLFTKQSASNLANCDHKLHFRKFVFTKGVMEEGGRDEELCQYEILNLKTFLNQKSFVVAVFAAARFSYKRRGVQKGYLLTPFHSIRCCCCWCTLRNLTKWKQILMLHFLFRKGSYLSGWGGGFR